MNFIGRGKGVGFQHSVHSSNSYPARSRRCLSCALRCAYRHAKGIGAKGGVVRYPLAQVTLQVIIRSADFPADFPEASRKLIAKYTNKGIKAAKAAEKQIPAKHWIDIPKSDMERYDEMFLGVRVELRDQLKIYHPYALKLMRKIRCRADKSRAECVGKSKE